MCSFFKEWVEVACINITCTCCVIVIGRFWQFHGLYRSRLFTDIFVDTFYLWCVDKGTLHTNGFLSALVEHIATSDELVGTCTVEDGLRVNGCCYLERDTSREVGFDITCDDAGGRTLGGDDHVDADSTSQLSNTCDRQFHLFACSHDEVAKLVDDDNDIRHVFMSISEAQFVVDVFLVILLDVSGSSLLE